MRRGRRALGPGGRRVVAIVRRVDDLPAAPAGCAWVRVRQLAALVCAADCHRPPSLEEVRAHHRLLEGLLRVDSPVPAPPELCFRSESDVARFLDAAYEALERAWALLDGHWEYRVHWRPRQGEATAALRQAAVAEFDALRAHARLALTLATTPGVLSAAFLVPRSRAQEFCDEVAARDRGDGSLRPELTGPWPAYDFVRFVEER